MDPNANLAEQRRLVATMLSDDYGSDVPTMIADAARLCELVQALDAWILRGGFLPADWQEVES